MYLQITEGGAYWVKPYSDHPYADIEEDGSFSVKYATGGHDEEAAVLHVMLIPGNFLPDSDFAKTRQSVLDYVKIYRDESGRTTIIPERRIP